MAVGTVHWFNATKCSWWFIATRSGSSDVFDSNQSDNRCTGLPGNSPRSALVEFLRRTLSAKKARKPPMFFSPFDVNGPAAGPRPPSASSPRNEATVGDRGEFARKIWLRFEGEIRFCIDREGSWASGAAFSTAFVTSSRNRSLGFSRFRSVRTKAKSA